MNLNVKVSFQDYVIDERSVLLVVNLVFILLFKTYAGIIRYTTLIDFLRILAASGSTFLFFLLANSISNFVLGKSIYFNSYLFLYFLISVSLMFFFRMISRYLFYALKDIQEDLAKTKIAVIGVGEESVAIAAAIMHNSNHSYRLECFVTNRSDSVYVSVLGRRIIHKDQFLKNKKIIHDLDALLLTHETLKKQELEEWMTLALDYDLRILKSNLLYEAGVGNMVEGIGELQIEDLLDRKPIYIEREKVKEFHFEKNILVTGGAGSIGSEIVRQLSLYKPSIIVIIDQAESPLYALKLDLQDLFPGQKFEFILADISNRSTLNKIFEKYSFDMVYHAAAYKHVPLIEENPQEAIFVNVLGTKNLALLAKNYKVNRFVMVSTDKAVNPSNVMGASKRTAELFVQSLQNTPDNITQFITTRFGNVLGSNGSVIPHFRKQIEKGGPVTITHPDIIRYFMTISEACELVLQANTMGSGGLIYVFDMGEPVRILDLAKRMIRLSGFTPDVDVKITFIGLRPGEKLYEELLSNNTMTMPTYHEKILICKDYSMEFNQIDTLSKKLISAALKEDQLCVVKILKTIVPEFKSNNSEFEILDKDISNFKNTTS
ncbi:polysaccharide biosynthesis protein [Chryseobacterium sp. G0162]|uniref:polysaccharide biosynthesis protein n=1 Tax=Chryseobacterium sp. G0162 TaxID=2487063 RepID=UPI001E3E5649|nr:nucleoside-diphosphate sugar epimerase/dehydratase [Chryseobacterium sp. G0162]